jgi:hypothetical protein
MKFSIKITLDFDEGGYLVFVEGIPELIGRGETEVKAILDFFQNYDKFKNKNYFDPMFIKNMLQKYEFMDEI